MMRGSRAGFTMVELMVVIAIISMFVGMVSVSFETLVPGERLNASIRELASELASIRTEAISRGMEFRIEYDMPNSRYRVVTPFRIGGGAVDTHENSDDEQDRYYGPWKTLQEGVGFAKIVIGGRDFVDTICFVRFDPLGAASDHSVILTQSAFGNLFTIEVLALSGLIRMHEGEYVREPVDDSDFD